MYKSNDYKIVEPELTYFVLFHFFRKFYETKKFCCFIWETLDCELDVATECNEQYSTKLESNTRDTFKKVCDQVIGTNYGWHCWFTENRIVWAGIIAGAILLFITVVCVFVGLKIHNNNK